MGCAHSKIIPREDEVKSFRESYSVTEHGTAPVESEQATEPQEQRPPTRMKLFVQPPSLPGQADGCSNLLVVHFESLRGASTSGGTVSPVPVVEETAGPALGGEDAERKASSVTATSQLVTPKAETSAARPSEPVVSETESTTTSLSASDSAKTKKSKGKGKGKDKDKDKGKGKGKGKKASKTLPAPKKLKTPQSVRDDVENFLRASIGKGKKKAEEQRQKKSEQLSPSGSTSSLSSYEGDEHIRHGKRPKAAHYKRRLNGNRSGDASGHHRFPANPLKSLRLPKIGQRVHQTPVEDCRGQTAALDPNSPGAWDDEEEIEEKKKKEREREKEKEKEKKARMKKEKSQTKKQPKPTYTKVKEFNKPLGTVATAIKTLGHPLRSRAPVQPDDADIVVIRQHGEGAPIQTYPLVEGHPASAAGSNDRSCSPGELSLDPETERLRAVERPPERREARPRVVMRECWSETSTNEGHATPDDEFEVERPSNPTPLSVRNLMRDQQQPCCSGFADPSSFQLAHSSHAHFSSSHAHLNSSHAHLGENVEQRCSGSVSMTQLVDIEGVEFDYGSPVQHRDPRIVLHERELTLRSQRDGLVEQEQLLQQQIRLRQSKMDLSIQEDMEVFRLLNARNKVRRRLREVMALLQQCDAAAAELDRRQREHGHAHSHGHAHRHRHGHRHGRRRSSHHVYN